MHGPLLLATTLTCLAATLIVGLAGAEQLPLTTVLPKLENIQEDAHNLLIKNTELKAQILVGLQEQNAAKIKLVKEAKLGANSTLTTSKNQTEPAQNATMSASSNSTSTPISPPTKPVNPHHHHIDFLELEEFNKWVDANLEYAVRNTGATIETLKEEAQGNKGLVDYSDQAIQDGKEGIKYWQSAVIFQEMTLKNEKFEIE